MNREEFINEVSKIGIDLSNDILEKLEKYYNMVIEFNNHTNLTRITEKEQFYLKHFYDSLTICKIEKLDNQKLLDVGSGAGFPGMVLKICFPNLKVTLIDSLNKRVEFLKSVAKKLDLKDISIYHERAEIYVKNNRESFDIVTSRAVANLNMLSELCIPFVKEKGYFIPMKAEILDEVNSSANAIKILGGKLVDIIEFNLPIENSKRTLLKIEKQNKTSAKYPRKFSEIKKKSL